MPAPPRTGGIDSSSRIINAVLSLQEKYGNSVSPEELDGYLIRALRVCQGDISLSVTLASELVETYCITDQKNTPCLSFDPLASVILTRISDCLRADDLAGLLCSAPEVRKYLVDVKSKKLSLNHILHPTTELQKLQLEKFPIDAGQVKSVTISKEEDAGNQIMVSRAEFPALRTVWWEPNDWQKVDSGSYVESPIFSLQGVNGLYFRFYPHGKDHSRKGFCSLYIGSDGTPRDVSIRLRLATTSHIITQKLNGEYVDGFVNFCDLRNLENSTIAVGVDVLHGPFDNEAEEMSLSCGPQWATWNIPRMTSSHLKMFHTGDRITSDVFSLDGLGDDACFVLYPKGDTVDAISKVGDFVNVGLFGSSDRDVTFRMTAGNVSKVLTACAERYRSKVAGSTKSCGEFFDSCFGSLNDLVDHHHDKLTLTLEVLNTTAQQDMISKNSTTKWCFYDASTLINSLNMGEMLHSRYFTMIGSSGVFFSMGLVFNEDEVELHFTQVNQESDCTTALVDLNFQTLRGEHPATRDITWKGLKDTAVIKFEIPEVKELDLFRVEATLKTFAHVKNPSPEEVAAKQPQLKTASATSQSTRASYGSSSSIVQLLPDVGS